MCDNFQAKAASMRKVIHEGGWDSLDEEAKTNLNRIDPDGFNKYKNQLIIDGHKWKDDAEDILRGYIWDMVEFYE